MRKIKNIHLTDDPDIYQCFGCSPYNPIGLHLEFWEDKEKIISFWTPPANLQSYPKVVHGGIQSTLMDEIAGWLVYVKCGTVGLTAEMKVRFKQPLYINNGKIEITAELLSQNSRFAEISTKLIDINKTVCAEGIVKYFLLPEDEAKSKYNYPGVEAFFEK